MYKMAVNEWYEELKHLSPADLRKGLNGYRGEYPPNLIQFYNACTEKPIGTPAPCYKTFKSETKAIENKSKTISDFMAEINKKLSRPCAGKGGKNT